MLATHWAFPYRLRLFPIWDGLGGYRWCEVLQCLN